MFAHLNVVAAGVFLFFFGLVTVLGFAAARWNTADLGHIEEWGLGGRRFGPWITWFLLGGDLYTAYTVIAVPAVVFAIGAYGFFAVPYTIIIYPFLYMTLPRLWAVCHKHGYMTAGDFVLGRYGNRGLEFAVALTGILATMPYIALQLVGLEKVILALGVTGQGIMAHAPITLAFVILALFTYKSGLRAPAMIAFVKDAMIYIFIIAAIVIIPYELGGFGAIFEAAGKAFDARVAANPKLAAGLTLRPPQVGPYITLAIGSAMALFMYPHALTGTLAASSGRAIRFNMMTLPAYSLALGFIALLGLMAIAAGVKVGTPQDAVPQLVLWAFPDWFAGFCFAAIALGALRPRGGNVDRRGQYLHPQRLEAVRPSANVAVRGSIPRQIDFADREDRRAPGDFLHADAVRPRSATVGRGLDGADLPGDDPGPLHALVQRLGAADWLGSGHDPGHVAFLDRERLGAGACAQVEHAFRRQCRSRPRPRRLQWLDRRDRQRSGCDSALVHPALACAGRDFARRLRGSSARLKRRVEQARGNFSLPVRPAKPSGGWAASRNAGDNRPARPMKNHIRFAGGM